MKKTKKILTIVILIEITIMQIILAIKISTINDNQKQLQERIKQLETDYKIYELNLSQLTENKKAHFGE